MIRKVITTDFEEMLAIINDSATAYKGVIPDDCWHDPYMSREYLADEIGCGINFFGYESNGIMQGIMGIQDVGDITLIRHAYVRTKARNSGIGSALMEYLLPMAEYPVLIGTWADAVWAVRFYQKHGFAVVSHDEKEYLLRKYWNIPDRQIETSVVLAHEQYFAKKHQ
ncbi:MAG TPA: GNAT family N-acetyltransferase [Spirochaetota bacterium]|nr:GNAT family N-acetyltransferase [Spirochaetota bacterium]HQP48308.1 GNAT family N-acetyltransferase [Spirochaetota bacterium]